MKTPYDFAKEELKKNIVELPGAKDHNPRIIWYHAFTTLKAITDEIPWCSSFVCAMAHLAGYKSTRSASAKSWLVPHSFLEEVESKDVKIGDLVIFKRGEGHHVAFVHYEFHPDHANIVCLGGNQANSLKVSKFKNENVLGFRRFKKEGP